MLAACSLPFEVADGGTTDTGNSLRELSGRGMEDGEPIAGLAVRLRRDDYLTPLPAGLKATAGLRGAGTEAVSIARADEVTDSRGRFLIRDVDTGTYRLEMGDGQGLAFAQDLDLRRPGERPGRKLDLADLHLAKPAWVGGEVLLRADAREAYVQVHGLERLAAVDLATGRFSLRLPSGRHRLRFVDRGCDPDCVEEKEVSAASGDSVDLGSVDLRDTAGVFAAWTRHARIGVNTTSAGAGVAGDVTGFPLLVRLDSSRFDFAQAKADGSDIRFSKAGSGEPLPFEIERWDAARGRAEIWVRLDTVKGDDAGQYFNVHWGNPAAEAASNGAAVFDTALGFSGVWHLAEAAGSSDGGFKDASGHANHGTGGGMGADSRMDGAVGAAQRFDGVDDFIRVADAPSLDVGTGDFTVSAWARLDTLGGKRQLVGKRTNPGADYEIQAMPAGTVDCHAGVEPVYQIVSSRDNLSRGTWHHLVFQRRGFDLFVYLDGKETGRGGDTQRDLDNDGDFWIGRDFADNLDEHWKGGIDEVRLMRSAPSADWIRLGYETQRPGSAAMVWNPPR